MVKEKLKMTAQMNESKIKEAVAKDAKDGLAGPRGIAFGLLICSIFWITLFLVLKSLWQPWYIKNMALSALISTVAMKKELEALTQMSKKTNKRIKQKQARRVMNAAGDFFKRVGSSIHKRHYGGGLHRNETRDSSQN